MRIADLTALIDRLFPGEAEASDEADAAGRAELAAILAAGEQILARPDGDSEERLAAWLDGALDGAERDRFEAEMARAPAELLHMQAVQSFVDAVAGAPLTAPDDLVQAAIAGMPAAEPPGRSQPLRQSILSWISTRPRLLGVMGGGIAVAFSLLLVVSTNLDRFAAAPLPRNAAVKTPAQDTAPGSRPAPSVDKAPPAASAPTQPSPAPQSPGPAAAALLPQASPTAPPPAAGVPAPAAGDAASVMDRYGAQQMQMEGASADTSSNTADRASCGGPPARDDEMAGAIAPDAKQPKAASHREGCGQDFANERGTSQYGAHAAPADAVPTISTPTSPPPTAATSDDWTHGDDAPH